MNTTSRRDFLAGLGVGLSTAALAGPSAFAAATPGQLMFVGTFTSRSGSHSKGIYACRWQAAAGKLVLLGVAAETLDPSFLALSPDHRRLYSVNEIYEYNGTASGSVSAFLVDAAPGKLSLRNVVSSGGTGPCNITVDHTGRAVFVADYAGGSLASFHVEPDGGLSAPVSNFHFTGHSVVKERQEAPHTHCVTVSPDNRFLVVNDLGLDRIMVFRIEVDTAKLTPNVPAYYEAIPGSGPRNFTFHPNGRWAYSLNEVGNTIDVLDWNSKQGTLTRKQNLSTLPRGFTGTSTAATVTVDRAGRFVYASNRGADTIAVFSVNAANGQLAELQQISCGGHTPRHFSLDPSGRWLLAANQDSGNIVILARDSRSGRLTATGTEVHVDAPVCLIFV